MSLRDLIHSLGSIFQFSSFLLQWLEAHTIVEKQKPWFSLLEIFSTFSSFVFTLLFLFRLIQLHSLTTHQRVSRKLFQGGVMNKWLFYIQINPDVKLFHSKLIFSLQEALDVPFFFPSLPCALIIQIFNHIKQIIHTTASFLNTLPSTPSFSSFSPPLVALICLLHCHRLW